MPQLYASALYAYCHILDGPAHIAQITFYFVPDMCNEVMTYLCYITSVLRPGGLLGSMRETV